MNFLYRIQTKDNTLFFKARVTQANVYCVKNLAQEKDGNLFICFLKKEVFTSNIGSTALKYFDLRVLKGYYPQLFVMSQQQLSVEEMKKLRNEIFHPKALNSKEETAKKNLIHHAFSLVK